MNAIGEAFHGLFRFFRDLGAVAPAAAAGLLLATPTVHREGGDLIVAGTLEGAGTPRLRRVLATGTPVELRFEGKLRAGSRMLRASDRSRVRRDVLAGTWRVGDVVVPTLEAALEEASNYRLVFAGVPQDVALELDVQATIDHPPGLDVPGAAAALWNHRKPFLRIDGLERMVRR